MCYSFVMARLALIGLGWLCMTRATLGQTPGTPAASAPTLARDKICTVTFKSDRTTVGFTVEFDKNCANLFPLVADVAGWNFPENDLLRLLEAQGKSLVELDRKSTR